MNMTEREPAGGPDGLVLPRQVRAGQAASWLAGHHQAKQFAARLRVALIELGYDPPGMLVTATVDTDTGPLVWIRIGTGGLTATLRVTEQTGLGQPADSARPADSSQPTVRGHP